MMVPFIDLMAVTIAFFIQAGAWTQVGGMAVSTASSRAPLKLALAQLKEQRPEHVSITVEADAAVAYDDLVRVIDQCVGSKFPDVAVSAAATRELGYECRSK